MHKKEKAKISDNKTFTCLDKLKRIPAVFVCHKGILIFNNWSAFGSHNQNGVHCYHVSLIVAFIFPTVTETMPVCGSIYEENYQGAKLVQLLRNQPFRFENRNNKMTK